MNKLTEAQIKALKKEHGSCIEIEVAINDEGEKAVCYLKKPSIVTLATASNFSEDKFRYLEVLFNGCWIKGDDRIRQDDEAKYTVMLYCDSFFQLREAEVKKH